MNEILLNYTLRAKKRDNILTQISIDTDEYQCTLNLK